MPEITENPLYTRASVINRETLLNFRQPILIEGEKALPLTPSRERVGGFIFAPSCPPESLGDAEFLAYHGVRFPYVTGAMANGIASEELVEAIARAGMLGFFGAAGLAPARVVQAIDRLQKFLPDVPWGINLIHSPNEPDLEAAVADLYVGRGIRWVEASAYLGLTLPIVKYRVAGIHAGPDGEPVAPNRVIAKVSRVEVAEKFMSPPPKAMLEQLVRDGFITTKQAELAERVPMAEDITAEADSGGHTDNRPLVTMLPSFLALRDRVQAQYNYPRRIRIGAAGGISTPASVAAAFAMGASYVLTGSVNQACMESGSSDKVRDMLAASGQADVTMAPAADMFEMGVKVQVLKRGTMFAMRGAKLYDAYNRNESWESVPVKEREMIERDILRAPFDTIWAQTRDFFLKRDPAQAARGDAEPKHRMALVFRWYLGLSSRWANAGEPTRQMDYQVWCGPAMGAFNEWAKGSFLEKRENRKAVTVAYNLLVGGAYQTRVNTLKQQGAKVPADLENFRPMELDQVQEIING